MLATTVAGAVAFAWHKIAQVPLSAVELENIEALTEDETGEELMKKCDTYCRYRSGYVCYLNTNYGFTIYCDEMVAWNF